MSENKTLEEIFAQVDELGQASVKRSNNYAKVTRKTTSTSSKKKEPLPWVKEEVSNKNYLTRNEELLSSIENIEYGTYNPNKIDGFQAALERYRKLAKNDQDNFKTIDKLIDPELRDADKKRDGTDYVEGYYDGLYVLNTIIYRSKLSRFAKLAGKIDE